MNIFEQATRLSLRFPCTKGNLSTEDIWNLPLDYLDSLGMNYKNNLEATKGKSLRKLTNTPVNSLDELRLSIIQHVIETKEAEEIRVSTLATLREQLSNIQELRYKKEQDSLSQLPLEELDKLISDIKNQMSSL